MVLLNGASGIAVGLATEIPSHNLGEVAQAAVAMIRNPKISHSELMALVPGPDFPAAARSSRRRRRSPTCTPPAAAPESARALEDRRTGARPVAGGGHRTAAGHLGAEGAGRNRRTDQPENQAGQEALTPEQLALKSLILNRSTPCATNRAAAPVRLVFEPKSKNQDQTEFMLMLLAHTSLESSASINLVMIGGDGRPRQKGLSDILHEWISFRFATVTRRTQFKLGKVDAASTSWKAARPSCSTSMK
jgi:topoisomerase-4 subunit A